MARGSVKRAATVALCVATLLCAGCSLISPPGSYPSADGPRNGDGFLVDPHTGVELPGQADPGI
jgi:hypothetical protein